MKIKQSVEQKQTQSMILKPKLIQSLDMLTLPLLELETYIKQEIIENPMLEFKDDNEDEENFNEQVQEDSERKEDEALTDENSEELKTTLEEVKELSEVLDYWNEEFSSNERKIAPDEKYETEKFIKHNENYRNKIYLQIDLCRDLEEKEKRFAYDMIESMNDHGFLPKDYDIYKEGKEFGLSNEQIEKTHNRIMNLEPKGLGARNVEECLIAQLDKNMHEYEYIKELIEKHFEDLIHKRYKKIASVMGVTEEMIRNWREIVAKLDPKPGLRIQEAEKNYIVPEIIIKKIDGKYEIIINDYNFPKIRLSRNYAKVLQEVKKHKSPNKKGIEYVREKINSAKFLIKSIYLRNRTLKRVMQEIINYQYDYFYKESKVLKPMGYAIIAERLGVNESTISRVVRAKYVDTPFGIIALKQFFSSKAGKDDNYNSISRQSVERMIKKLIENENKSNPLTDNQIAKILKEKGMNVSRRVIAKYRKKLGYLNSHLRKI